MSHDGGLEYYALTTGLVFIGAGIYGALRSAETARRNQARIDSGEEGYFEERRSWKHYGPPVTDPDAIRRFAWLALIGGVVLLLTYSPISIFHWS